MNKCNIKTIRIYGKIGIPKISNPKAIPKYSTQYDKKSVSAIGKVATNAIFLP